MNKFVSIAGLLLLVGVAASAQEYFTVLNNNTDAANQHLYVELMYDKPECRDAQATFVLKWRGDSIAVAVDSFLNNAGTFETEAAPPYWSIKRPMAAGYRLRFKLPAGAAADKNPQVCVKSHLMAVRCNGCGAGGSNAIFNESSIAADCPYANTQGDLRACRRRVDADGQWEAWIQDTRDCKMYRAVHMPASGQGRWWFAQNLNYQKDLTPNGNANTGATEGGFWCPGGRSAELNKPVAHSDAAENMTAATSGDVACTTYGALYTWNTATSLNGRGAQNLSQGICPDGWRLPAEDDFGILFNSGAIGEHTANQLLKSTLSCRPHASAVDSACATATVAAWAWCRADYEGKVPNPLALGEDRFGFSLLPAGMNNRTDFTGLGYAAHLWTSTPQEAGFAISLKISDIKKFTVPIPQLFPTETKAGLSVRCTRTEGGM